jgi:ribonuclease Z
MSFVMKLHPVLVNPEYQDPVLLISIPQKAEVLIFDLGYCFRLKIRDIQKITRIFISHTHIDHFAGFDHILRLSVDIEKTVSVYGPPGIIRNVEGKLAGYFWNLKAGVMLNFEVNEVHPDKILRKRFIGNEGYENPEPPEVIPHSPSEPLVKTDEYSVFSATLNHRMPVLAYRIEAVDSYNADVEVMKELGLSPGKWVGELKRYISENVMDAKPLEIDGKHYDTGELASKIIGKNPGTRIAYIVDTICDDITAPLAVNIARQADYLFCECAYMNAEKDLAAQNYHLTATQAATIASEAGVGQLIPFHFSKRYDGKYHLILDEARLIFPEVGKADKY